MRRFFIACTLPALLACGRRQGRLPGPPPDMQVEAPALDTWPLMREAARIAADSGRFDEADRMLAAYIAGRPGTDEVNKAALARALLLVDPRNPAASTAAAVDALGTLLRRSPERREEVITVGDLEIDPRRHKVTRAGTLLTLTPKEFSLLLYPASSAGDIVSRTEIVEQVWDINFDTGTNVVDVMMRRLRAKVDDPFETKMIQTIRGVGYVLRTE